MIGRIVEIAEDGRHLSVHRGFLVVESGGEELGRVPLDDIGAVIANAHGLTYTANLVTALAHRNVTMVFCGPNHQPVATIWPIEGHHAQTARMRAQVAASLPLMKRLWQGLIRAKIRQQGSVLAALGVASGAFDKLARDVKSGDPENIEAQAARRYWRLLMGEDFRRDRELPGSNALLNYGYAILRSTTARAVAAAGLHPTLGVHHRNRGNPLCLVDDLMEPFRPIVDLAVVRLAKAGVADVTPEAKRSLAALTWHDMRTSKGVTPLSTCAARLAVSLAMSFEMGRPNLDLPLEPLPIDLNDIGAAPAPATTDA